MTEKQLHIYNFIVEHYKTHGYSPAIEVIKAEFGYKHHQSVSQHIEALVRKGFLTRPANKVIIPVI